MADLLSQNGLSTGAFNAPTGGAALPLIGQGSRPVDLIPAAAVALTTVGFLHYPSDLPKYYMGFQIMKYARNSLLEVAVSTPLNQVALPFPDRLLDNNSVAYAAKGFSATIGSALNASFDKVHDIQNQIQQGASTADIISNATKVGGAIDQVGAAALPGLAVDAGTAAFGESGQAALGAAGYSPNYFLTVVLQGPAYKQYSCSWTFSPRNAKEMVDLTQIFRVFKDAQAPGLAAGGALFTFPRIFQNYYAPNRGLLYQFKPSVLVNCAIDYTGGGMPSMKQASSLTNNWNGATAIKMQCTFWELEFWLRSDFGDASPGASGIQLSADQIHPIDGGGRYAQ